MSFSDKLNAAIAQHHSLLTVDLSPDLEIARIGKALGLVEVLRSHNQLELLLQDAKQRLLSLIQTTTDCVCAYTLRLEAFRVLGAPGLTLLETVLAAVPPYLPVILDAKHSDPDTSTILAELAFELWQVDAITLSPYTGQDQAAPFLVDANKTIFVLTATGNPTAAVLQQFPTPETPFYQQLASEAKTWGTPEQVCFELGTVSPATLQSVRAIAPERTIWLNGRWQHDTNWDELLIAGMNGSESGLLFAVPADYLTDPAGGILIRELRDRIYQARQSLIVDPSTCQVWVPDVCLLNHHPYEDLVLQLYDIGCLRFGEFVQASGAVFPYYVDLRVIISNPQVFDAVISAYSGILRGLTFDRVAGIPYGSLPTATGLSLRLNTPMIFPRKEVKAHGAKRLVEGHFNPGETAVLVDDILISGSSAIEGARKLESVGLQVQDIVVFIDHEKGVKDRIRQQGYKPYSVLTLSEIGDILCEAGRISETQLELLLAHQD
ncbi:MAG: orotate phosphoribosyltransferase [Thainema sp.]